MAQFRPAATTNQGIALMTRLLSEDIQIEFTKLVTGCGEYNDADVDRAELQKAEKLKNEKQSFPFSAITAVTDSCVLLKTLISNERLTEGYRLTEIGVYAKEKGTEGDGILYSVCVALEADYFPKFNGLATCEIIQEYYITISNAADVTIQVDRDAPVLTEEFEDFKKKVEEEFNSLPKVIIADIDTVLADKDILLVLENEKINAAKQAGVVYPLSVKAADVVTDDDYMFVSKTEKEQWEEKPGPDSPISSNYVEFVIAAAREMIASGEDLSTLFGKLERFLTDLKSVAFSGSYADLNNKPTLGNAASMNVANNCSTTAQGYVLDARQGKALLDLYNQINSNFRDGCSIIAGKITACGVATASNAAPQTMANNIQAIFDNRYTNGYNTGWNAGISHISTNNATATVWIIGHSGGGVWGVSWATSDANLIIIARKAEKSGEFTSAVSNAVCILDGGGAIRYQVWKTTARGLYHDINVSTTTTTEVQTVLGVRF